MLAPPVDLDLEVAGAARRSRRASSGVTPQPKCSNASVAGSQVASTAGPEALEVAVLVARDRAGRSGRRRPAADRRRPGAGRGRRPRCDSSSSARPDGPAGAAPRTPRRASRRGSSRPARSRSRRPGRRPGPPHPRCRPAGGRTARGRSRTVSSGRTGSAVGAGAAAAGPAELRRLRQPVERLRPRRPAPRRARRAAGSRAARRAAWTCPRPASSAATMIGTRASMSEPERGRELRVERAGADELDDRSRFGRRGRNGERPRAPTGDVGHRREPSQRVGPRDSDNPKSVEADPSSAGATVEFRTL